MNFYILFDRKEFLAPLIPFFRETIGVDPIEDIYFFSDFLCTCLQETAKSVIEDDSFYTLSLLKRGVCHGLAPQTFVCCICNCSLSKESAVSAIRVFSCGHATHLQCESEQSKSSNRDSKDGCPICLSTSNTQAQNKSPISENGLGKHFGAESEVSHGTYHTHETDHVDRSRGLQQMSRVIISFHLSYICQLHPKVFPMSRTDFSYTWKPWSSYNLVLLLNMAIYSTFIVF